LYELRFYWNLYFMNVDGEADRVGTNIGLVGGLDVLGGGRERGDEE
jgi:hypothetical protein